MEPLSNDERELMDWLTTTANRESLPSRDSGARSRSGCARLATSKRLWQLRASA